MKVNDFINKAKAIEKMKTKYGWGFYMNKKEGNTYLCDCSGLIKAILWGYPEKGSYGGNKVPDMNAGMMIDKCSQVTSDFTKAKPGWLVWMKGHIGIYIGDGVVIESTAANKNKVLYSYCKGSGFTNKNNYYARQWEKCGMFDKYIEY